MNQSIDNHMMYMQRNLIAVKTLMDTLIKKCIYDSCFVNCLLVQYVVYKHEKDCI